MCYPKIKKRKYKKEKRKKKRIGAGTQSGWKMTEEKEWKRLVCGQGLGDMRGRRGNRSGKSSPRDGWRGGGDVGGQACAPRLLRLHAFIQSDSQ